MNNRFPLLESDEIDLCFTANPLHRLDFEWVELTNEEIFLAVPNNHRLATRKHIDLFEAADEPFVGYKEQFIFQKAYDTLLHSSGFTPNFVCRVDSPAAVASLVSAGLGVALFGCKQRERDDLTLLSILKPICRRSFGLIWNNKRYMSLAARKFCDFLIEYFELND